MSADRALSLLFNAARVSPPLRDAVQEVEDEMNRLRDLLNSAADALAQYYDDESYAEEGLIQLIEEALGNGQRIAPPKSSGSGRTGAS